MLLLSKYIFNKFGKRRQKKMFYVNYDPLSFVLNIKAWEYYQNDK